MTGVWLMKSEPEVYSIDDLARDGTTCWEGVRNYQARNFMRDDMKVGDKVLFYHSNASPPGIAGLANVVRTAYPDHTAMDPKSRYFDPRSTPEKPVWMMVDIGFVESFREVLPLERLRQEPGLEGMMVIRKGTRLSVQPVEPAHFKVICKIASR